MLYGVLLTFRRPDALRHYLAALGQQTRRPDVLVLVDNDPGMTGRAALDAHLEACGRSAEQRAAERIEYLPQSVNLGSAGGWAAGQRFVAEVADPDDWFVVLDDDDPPRDRATLQELERFTHRMKQVDPATAAVGRTGAFFEGSKGRIRRLAKDDLHGPVQVDVLGCGHFPFYEVGVMQKEGTFLAELFFGYVELEYGRRLRARGYHLYVDGDAIRARRQTAGRLDDPARVRSELRTSLRPWRVYCTTRNLIFILRREGHDLAALRVAARRGIGRPLTNLVLSPTGAIDYLRAGWHASVDGWRARLGRAVDPTSDRLVLLR
jgi:rhamnopyranosyl-N-acetylglucosaminyl-diphospho-decaprenol beta-1,3/1,4-galactofuranosyltransferase